MYVYPVSLLANILEKYRTVSHPGFWHCYSQGTDFPNYKDLEVSFLKHPT